MDQERKDALKGSFFFIFGMYSLGLGILAVVLALKYFLPLLIVGVAFIGISICLLKSIAVNSFFKFFEKRT